MRHGPFPAGFVHARSRQAPQTNIRPAANSPPVPGIIIWAAGPCRRSAAGRLLDRDGLALSGNPPVARAAVKAGRVVGAASLDEWRPADGFAGGLDVCPGRPLPDACV